MIPAAHQTMLAPQGAPLPYDYVCQYHTFDGTQCIESGVVPTNQMKVRVVYDGTYPSGEEANVVGLYDNTSGTANRVYVGPYYLSRYKARCMLIASEYNISQDVRNTHIEQIVDIPNAVHSIVKNGSTYTAPIGNFGSFVTQKSLGLGSRNWYGTSSPYHKNEYGFAGKIFSFEAWSSGTKSADWIPVVDNNGVACFYDQIDGALHYPWTGNPLVAGPDK